MSRVTKFGVFEADLSSGELRKQGRLIRLQQQPFELLRCLLEQPGEIVTRESLRERLWPADVTVDFDQSLNKCVTKLRDALGDSASSPRFVETLPKRGYRFIAPITVTVAALVHEPEATPALEPAALPQPLLPSTDTPASPAFTPRMLVPLGIMAGLVVLLLNFAGSVRPPNAALAQVASAATMPTGTDDTDAIDTYRRGRVALSRRTEEGLRTAVVLFDRALSLDPRYAAAHVGLADAWSLLASHGIEEPGRAYQMAREAANRALTLNPDQADAHASLGRITMVSDWDWKIAEWHFQRAIEIDETLAIAHQWYAYMLSAVGRHAEAEREARRAAALDPASLSAATGVGYVLYAARRFDEAAVALRRVIEVDPDFRQARRNLGLVLAQQGRDDEAKAEFERVVRLSNDGTVAIADLAWIRGRSGDVAGARRLLAQLQARNSAGYVPPDAMAIALTGAAQIEEAVRKIEEAVDARAASMAHLATDPVWDQLRDVPRVLAMADAVKRGPAGRP